MVHEQETINEHIRNALSPIVGLLDLLEKKGVMANLSDDEYDTLLSIFITSSHNSIELLKTLGMHAVEPNDSQYYILKNKYNG